jgi:hypothetical protein
MGTRWLTAFVEHWRPVYQSHERARSVQAHLKESTTPVHIGHTLMWEDNPDTDLSSEVLDSSKRTNFDVGATRESPASSIATSTPVTSSQRSRVLRREIFPAALVSYQSKSCSQCGKLFSNIGNLNKHINDKHVGFRYPCKVEGCSKNFSRKAYLLKHVRARHKNT